jgi:hypothetical protein
MDFAQKRKKHRLEWQVEEEGVRVRQEDADAHREFHIPFENISVVLTLSEIKPNHKPGREKRLFFSGALFSICAMIALTAPISGLVFWIFLAVLQFYRAAKKGPFLQYISTAFSANSDPVFWFFLPIPEEKQALEQFVDKVFDARNAYLREKYLPQVAAAKAPYEVHSLVLSLRREKVITEAEFQAFKDRFAPQKPHIGF